jgi:hypothetical protein
MAHKGERNSDRTIAQISLDWTKRAYASLYAIYRTARREKLPLSITNTKFYSGAVSVSVKGKGSKEVYMVAISPFNLANTHEQIKKWDDERKALRKGELERNARLKLIALSQELRDCQRALYKSIVFSSHLDRELVELERDYDALIDTLVSRNE